MYSLLIYGPVCGSYVYISMDISGINISDNYHWHSLTSPVDDTITRNGSFTANHHLDDAQHTCLPREHLRVLFQTGKAIVWQARQ